MEAPDKVGRALARPEKCHIRKGVEFYSLIVVIILLPNIMCFWQYTRVFHVEQFCVFFRKKIFFWQNCFGWVKTSGTKMIRHYLISFCCGKYEQIRS